LATYEIVLSGAAPGSPVDLVDDLPPVEIGEVLFYQGGFWRVDAVKAAESQAAAGRLVVSRTTDAPEHPTAS
jgi:hypothetical protein